MAQATATAEANDLPVLDRSHLRRMTGGAKGLEHELLLLFDTQCAVLMERMAQSTPPARATLAHTLKGSALGMGALRVAAAAAAVETTGNEQTAALMRLNETVQEARIGIARLLACAAE